MKRLNRTVGDNETFVTLTPRSSTDTRRKKDAERNPPTVTFSTQVTADTLVEEMRMKGAPVEFFSAISALLDDDVAERAKELIQK